MNLEAILAQIESHPNATFNVASLPPGYPTIAELIRELKKELNNALWAGRS